eukprot:scaffold1389_cov122-Cylindrotheca_fusiformis.AAC.15
MEDGYFSDKIEIRRGDPSNPNSFFGYFAIDNIEEDELLLNIPPEARLESHSVKEEYTDILCDLAWALKREFDKGYNSDYVHYVNYLKEQRRDIIPAVWSNGGKELLMEVQGSIYMTDVELETTDAENMVDWIDDWMMDSCLMNEEGTECLDPYFVAVVTQRGFDSMLAPVYDMINHHNGKINTINKRSVYDKEYGFDVYSSEPIAAGDQLFISYYNCPDCRGCDDCPVTQNYWGTPEMLRDFGFVEPLPQYYYLGDEISFRIYQNNDNEDDDSPKIEFLKDWYPTEDIIEEAKGQIERLQEVYEYDLLPANGTIAKHEYYTIERYLEALMTAFTTLVEAYYNDEESGDKEEEEEPMILEEESALQEPHELEEQAVEPIFVEESI